MYAAHGVKHVWLVEPLDRLIEVLSLDGDAYRITQTATGDARCRNKPFEALELELSVLWAR